MLKIILVLLAAYLIGSINNSIIICSLKGIDIKKVGSGNAGATNTVRALGKKYGIIVFLLDFLKGVIACIIARIFTPEYVFIAGILTVIGHTYPVFFDFKGGKGVSTTFGVLLAVDYRVGLVVGILELLLIYITKIVAISSIVSFAVLPPVMLYFSKGTYLNVYASGFLTVLVIFAHRDNIKRLIKGEENSFKKKK